MAKINYVIIGAGVAGISALVDIRNTDKKSKIYLIDNEGFKYYYRGALKFYVKGDLTQKQLNGMPDVFYKKLKVDLIQDVVKEIDFKEKSIKLEKTEPIKYDKLLIANENEIILNKNELNDMMEDFKIIAFTYNDDKIKKTLKKYIPEYLIG